MSLSSEYRMTWTAFSILRLVVATPLIFRIELPLSPSETEGISHVTDVMIIKPFIAIKVGI